MISRGKITGAVLLLALTTGQALSAPLPGPADSGRVDVDRKPIITQNPAEIPAPEVNLRPNKAPQGSEKIQFVLKDIKVEGQTAFSEEEIKAIYQDYIGKNIALSEIWHIADLITDHYQQKGYFLSRAYVPEQDIKDGVITIKIVEGYVSEVQLDDPIAKKHVIKQLVKELKKDRPTKIGKLESVLLRLNDLAGVSFRSIVEPIENNNEGAVKLVLIKSDKNGNGSVGLDNYNSRYFGIYQAVASYDASIIPLQRTSVSVLAGTHNDRLKYFSALHEIPLTDDISMQLSGDYTIANPGYVLAPQHIEGTTKSLAVAIKKQIIRQRSENLSATLVFSGKNNFSDVTNQPLTRDRVRTAKIVFSYDTSDSWNGYNLINLTFTHGLDILHASPKGQAFLSRSRAKPDFAKAELGYVRFQSLSDDFGAVLALNGQLASNALYSSEQIGYGGQSIGRGYDPSEIIGDEGIKGSFELRYLSLESRYGNKFTPYGFYDAGKVWAAGSKPVYADSAGVGTKIETDFGVNADFTVTQQLKSLPGSNGNDETKTLFQILYKF